MATMLSNIQRLGLVTTSGDAIHRAKLSFHARYVSLTVSYDVYTPKKRMGELKGKFFYYYLFTTTHMLPESIRYVFHPFFQGLHKIGGFQTNLGILQP